MYDAEQQVNVIWYPLAKEGKKINNHTFITTVLMLPAIPFSELEPKATMLLIGNVVALFRAEFAGRDDILRALEKPPALALSRTQAAKIVAFARKHYHRIGSLIVHQLTEKNIGHSTLVSNNLKQFCNSHILNVYATLILIFKFTEDYKRFSTKIQHPLLRSTLFVDGTNQPWLCKMVRR